MAIRIRIAAIAEAASESFMIAYLLVAALVLGGFCRSSVADDRNLIRNGSFEGSLRYWFASRCRLQRDGESADRLLGEGAASGGHYLTLGDGVLRSGPFQPPKGAPLEVSAAIRGSGGGSVSFQLAPADRSRANTAAQRGRRLFRRAAEGGWRLARGEVVIGDEDPAGSYVLQVRAEGGSIDIDAIAVCVGGSRSGLKHIPSEVVEIAADVENLPGYRDNGNLLTRGFRADVRSSLHNASDKDLSLTVRWELLDYQGGATPVPAWEEPTLLAAGETKQLERTIPLDYNGLLIVRVSAIDSSGATLSSSDVPVTVLPFPKAATAPDWHERIGASFRGPHTMRLGQRIGFRWTRWYPLFGWHRIQPNGPGEWKWPDETVRELADHGMCINAVLFGEPKWAMAEGDGVRLKDMDWGGDDPRWEDTSRLTDWDRFVTEAVKRYRDREVAWEFVNEPDHPHAEWSAGYYTALAKRTAKIARQADPDAFFLTNQIEPGIRNLQKEFVRRGGAKVVDAHSWHNYGAGAMGDQQTIRRIKRLFRSGGNPDAEIWFNEGGAHCNSAQDFSSLAVGSTDHVEWAHATTRSLAQMLSAGGSKHIAFHIGYEGSPRSWWDWLYNGGTELWDDQGYPTAGPATWNVIIDSLGLSEPVGTIESGQVTAHVFDDLRNGRGVAVVYTNGASGRSEPAIWPLPGEQPLTLRDVMGNETRVRGEAPVPGDGAPVYLYAARSSGKQLLTWLTEGAQTRTSPQARSASPSSGPRGPTETFRAPRSMVGERIGYSAGNPLRDDLGPRWRVDQVYPNLPSDASRFRPMVWDGVKWVAPEQTRFAGAPNCSFDGGRVVLGVRAAWSGQKPEGAMTPALVFIAPRPGVYDLRCRATNDQWAGQAAPALEVYRTRAGTGGAPVLLSRVRLPSGEKVSVSVKANELGAGDELVVTPRFDIMHNASAVELTDIFITRSGQ